MSILIVLTCIVLFIYFILLLSRKIPGGNKFFLYSAITLLPIAVYLILTEIAIQNLYREIDTWPRTEAEIIQKKIAGNRAVLPEVTYIYQVADSSYTGKTNLGIPAFGGRNKRTITARIALHDLPIGSKLIIAYNPANPVISTTQFHPPWNHYMKLGFAGCLYICASLILLFKIPIYKKRELTTESTE